MLLRFYSKLFESLFGIVSNRAVRSMLARLSLMERFRIVNKDRSDQTEEWKWNIATDGSIDRHQTVRPPADLQAICWGPTSAFDGVDVGQEWHPTTTTLCLSTRRDDESATLQTPSLQQTPSEQQQQQQQQQRESCSSLAD